ncbi:MAG: ABC transporter transmembrane domain-containing protein [Christensenella sp.]|nr:ABC transporter transmembrane domain-containing protein [Christensenella sp.]
MNKKRKPTAKGIANTPVVMQMEPLESGAAALCMVLAYCGKWLPLEQVRKDCGIGRDGVRPEKIIKAANGYGLDVKEISLGGAELRQKGAFPCMIFWEQSGFAVLCGFRGENAVINHPAFGRVVIPMEAFLESYDGKCMLFTPNNAFVADGKRASMWSFAKSRMKGNGSVFLVVVLLTLILTVITMVNPAFSRVFLDQVLGAQNNWLVPFLLILLSFNILQLVVGLSRELYMLKMEGKFAITSNSRFMWHVLRLPVEFFATRQTGDILERSEANEALSNMIMTTLAPMVLDVISLVLYLVVVLQYSVMLTMIGVASLVINMLVSQFISKKRVNIARVTTRDSGKFNSATVSGIEMMETIKASGAENGFFQRWAGYQANMNAGFVKKTKLDQSIGMIPELVTSLSNILILVLGVWLVILGQWTVGMILAFQGYLAGLVLPARRMISARATIQEMRSDVERIEDVMGYPTDVEFDEKKISQENILDKLSGNIELKNVTFGYSKQSPPLIEDFSLTIRPGNKIAFVGFSGCGKSTIAKMLSGLYAPWSGEILYDGKSREHIPREIFTASLAVVDQDVILFDDTIANNIKMWDDSIEDFAMICAARDAGMHEVIMQRKEGYRHKLVKGGVDLSGGQRQRLEIARVLAQDPTVIIMDEATSALDAKTEFEVVQSIARRGITSIVIAHRLSTIRDADEIIVLDKGKVVERGTHDELFANGGLYTKLVSSE